MLCLSTSLHESLQDRYPVFLWVILLTGHKCLPGCTSVDMWCSMNKFFSPFAKLSSPVSPITSSISSTSPLSKYLLLSLLLLRNHLPPPLLSLLLPPSPPPIFIPWWLEIVITLALLGKARNFEASFYLPWHHISELVSILYVHWFGLHPLAVISSKISCASLSFPTLFNPEIRYFELRKRWDGKPIEMTIDKISVPLSGWVVTSTLVGYCWKIKLVRLKSILLNEHRFFYSCIFDWADLILC